MSQLSEKFGKFDIIKQFTYQLELPGKFARLLLSNNHRPIVEACHYTWLTAQLSMNTIPLTEVKPASQKKGTEIKDNGKV